MSLSPTDLSKLLGLLKSLEAAATRDTHAALAQILAAFAALPPNLQKAMQALKKPGAWPDKPLAPNTTATLYYIVDPCAIEVENMSPALLQAELTAQAKQQPPPSDQYGNALVTLTLLLTPPTGSS